MQLTEEQTNRAWENMITAEVRAMYFADLASESVTLKQIITGVSFFLASGAAATLAAELPKVIPLAMSIVSAIATAYSMAVGLDKKSATLAKLQTTWSRLADDYEHLWNHWYEDDADGIYRQLATLARDASELASTESSYDESRVERWRRFVLEQHGLNPA
jgi:hypothetical protein